MTSFEPASIGILGRGFGLYGYLPAAISTYTGPFFLPTTYRETFARREELQRFSDQITWLATEHDVIQQADVLILARRPQDTMTLLPELLAHKPGAILVLEKPLTPDPASTLLLLNQISQHGLRLKAGFTFRWAPWAQQWLSQMVTPVSTRSTRANWLIRWSFMAHHYANDSPTWKRQHEAGGGALRFYGIHLIALLAEWGYCTTNRSQLFFEGDGSASRWRAVLGGPQRGNVEIDLDTRAERKCFEIYKEGHSAPNHAATDPFDVSMSPFPWPNMDRRCTYLAQMLGENLAPTVSYAERLSAATTLWQCVESRTTFHGLNS